MNKINGKLLRKLREENGYSLREFAALVYSSKSSVQRWEKTYAPEDPELLARIAEIYRTTVEALREQSEEYKKKKPSPEHLIQAKYGTVWLTVAIILLFILGALLLFL